MEKVSKSVIKFLCESLKADINRLSKKKVVEGDELYISDADFFGTSEEVEMNFVFGDGVAVSEDHKYIMLYTKKANLTREKREYIQDYDGIPSPRSYTYRDIAMFEGKIFENPYF